MESKYPKLNLAALILAGLFLIVMFASSVSTSRENKRLKRAINENIDKIESLEQQKQPLFDKITEDSLEIVKKDSLIFYLKTKEAVLLNNIKYFKNENARIKTNYINNTIDQRVDIFAKLATRADSLQ